MLAKMCNLIKFFSDRIKIPAYLLSGLLAVLLLFFALDWFVSVPLRSAKIDRYILFSMAETSRFYYAKTAMYNPFVFLNPNAKPIYALISAIFLIFLPLGIISLKILNSLLSVGTIVALYKLSKKIGLSDFTATLAAMLTLTFPLFFLLSIAALSELLFCFFLVTAFYFLYSKRYLASALLISLAPLIRQEGGIYLAIIGFFLLKLKKGRYLLILLIPAITWVLLNSILLKHSFIYSFLVSVDLPGPTAKSDVLSWAEWQSFLPLVFLHPLFLLFPLGLAINLFRKDYLPITASLITHSLFLIIAAFAQFLFIQKISYDFRYFLPLIPFMALVSAALFEKNNLSNKARSLVLAAALVILSGILIEKVRSLQANPRVITNALSQKQEESIKDVSLWLNGFLATNNLRSIFYSGDLTTDKIIRQIKFYLSPGIMMYPVRDFTEVYDPVTFKKLEDKFQDNSRPGLILVLDPLREKPLTEGPKTELIKHFPAIPIYFYRKN